MLKRVVSQLSLILVVKPVLNASLNSLQIYQKLYYLQLVYIIKRKKIDGT